MKFKHLIAISYILTGTAIIMIIGLGAYAKISGKGLPIAASTPLLPNNLPASSNSTGASATGGDTAVNYTGAGASSSPTTNPASTSKAPAAGSSTSSSGSTTSGSSGSGSTGSGGSSGGSGTTPPPTTPPPTTPPPTPPPPAPCGGQTPCYTTATVSTHNSQSNCWVMIGSVVYNVTAYVPQHPGGQSVFNSSTCGHDITAYMSGSASTGGARHSHSNSAYNILNSYKIGYDY